MEQKKCIEVCLTVPGTMQEEASLFLADASGRSVIVEDESQLRGGARIRGIFEASALDASRRKDLDDYLERLRGYGMHPLGMKLGRVSEDDWLQEWRDRPAILRAGSLWVIRPPWAGYSARPGEKVVILGTARAFGSGRHPSTVLSLEALERAWLGGMLPGPEPVWNALDVGTGTGVLAIAAAHLGGSVLAIDIDDEAVAAAEENLVLNSLQHRVKVEDTPLGFVKGRFRLILANLTFPSQLELANNIAGLLLPGCVVILSGLLAGDAETIEERYRRLGLRCEYRLGRGNWTSAIVRSPADTARPSSGPRQ